MSLSVCLINFSKEAGKKQYLIPYFIAAHPGCEDEDMVNLALWLKRNDLKVDQVQTFYPSPMSLATAMYYSERDPLHKLTYKSKKITIPRSAPQRKLHKALLRYHDPDNANMVRDILLKLGRKELIGNGPNQLVEEETPQNKRRSGSSSNSSSNRKPNKVQSKGHNSKTISKSKHTSDNRSPQKKSALKQPLTSQNAAPKCPLSSIFTNRYKTPTLTFVTVCICSRFLPWHQPCLYLEHTVETFHCVYHSRTRGKR